MKFRNQDKQTYTHTRVIKADVTLKDGDFVEIGREVCPAGQVWDMGYGANLGQQDSLGRMYFAPQIADGSAIEGELRIMRVDANNIPTGLVFSGHTSELTATVNDRTTQRVYDVKNMAIKENSQYVYYFKNDMGADKLMDKAKTKFYADGMRYMTA